MWLEKEKTDNFPLRIILPLFIGIIILSLGSLSWFTFKEVKKIQNFSSFHLKRLSNIASKENSDALQKLGETLIREKARDIAKQLEVYLKLHPYMKVVDLQKDKFFQNIAVQKIGKTGYTAITDCKRGVCIAHKYKKFVNMPLKYLAGELPDFWRIISQSFKGKNTGGYYLWKDPDGKIRKKYMWIQIVSTPTADNVILSVAATAYIDEFLKPVKTLHKKFASHIEHEMSYWKSFEKRLHYSTLITTFLILGITVFLITWLVLLLIKRQKIIERSFRELQKSEEKYKNLVENTPGIICKLSPEGTTIFVNSYVEKLTGYKPEELIGKNWWEIFYPENLRSQVDELYSKFREGDVVDYEMVLLTKDKRQLTISWNSFNKWKEGKLIEINGVGVDITARKFAEKELTLAHSQLLQSEKLASIGQLAAGIAHEINNPIAFVFSNMEILKKYIDNLVGLGKAIDKESDIGKLKEQKAKIKFELIEEDIYQILKESNEGLSRVTEIVRNLRSFSRVDQIKKMIITDINECIKETLMVLHNELKYDIDVQTYLKDISPVKCNPGQINQVLLNIIMNAIQAIRAKKDIRGKIIIRTYEEERYVICEIEDNGVGIPEEIKNKVFEPFFTTKEVGEGTGLGLHIAYDIIVNKHKGEISFKSKVNEGTIFIIKLPKEV